MTKLEPAVALVNRYARSQDRDDKPLSLTYLIEADRLAVAELVRNECAEAVKFGLALTHPHLAVHVAAIVRNVDLKAITAGSAEAPTDGGYDA